MGANRTTASAGRRSDSGSGRPDSGSAVAEFVMVSALLALVFAALLQIGLALHVRNTVVDSAIAGARMAAAVDRTEADGARHTAALIAAAVDERYAQDIRVDTAQAGPQELITVTVRVPVPVVGFAGVGQTWELTGRAFAEDAAL